jgi:preprotein translocase subunit SecD
MFVINNNNQNYIEIEAIVSNVKLSQEEYTDIDGNRVDATYNVTVKYTVDGKEYDAKLDDVSEYNVGDKMKIYYNPKDPSQITQTKSLIIPIVIVVAGIISLVGGIMSGLNAIKRYKKMKEQERGWNNE